MKLTLAQTIFCITVTIVVMLMLGYLIRDFVGKHNEQECFRYCDNVGEQITEIYNLLTNAEIYDISD